jgi:eukaryotic-like serine/threonine-protein kinase
MNDELLAARLVVVLFSDIADSSEIRNRVGDMRFKELLDQHNRCFDELAAAIPGVNVIKHTGDGYMMTFPTATAAVRFALALQHKLLTHSWPDNARIASRVGIHLGEVIDVIQAGRADIIGRTADNASRVMSLAMGGQILLTRGPYDSAVAFLQNGDRIASLPPLRWESHGSYVFKGSPAKVEVFEVGLEGVSPFARPPSADKARRADDAPSSGSSSSDATTSWTPQPDQEVPSKPGWKVTRQLGQGVVGPVWLCERDGIRHAFKFLDDPRFLLALRRERDVYATISQRLGRRDDIVPLIEVNLDVPPYFIESDFAEGGDLAAWAKSRGGLGKVSLPHRLEIVRRIADALAAAHRVGVLHCDVKPTNILMDDLGDALRPRGETERGSSTLAEVSAAGASSDSPTDTAHYKPRLSDFGLGEIESVDRAVPHLEPLPETLVSSRLTTRGAGMYVPPEVIAGQPFTTRSDVYALGVVLYQMASGDFSKPLGQGWERDIEDPLLREDIARCIDRVPENRIPAAELADRLRNLTRRRTQKRRKKLVRLALAGAVCAVVAASLTMAGVAIRAYVREAQASRKSTEFLTHMLDSLDPRSRKSDLTVATMLDTAAAQINAGELKDQPPAKATVCEAIGKAYLLLRKPQRAEQMFDLAATAYASYLEEDSAEFARARLARVHALLDISAADSTALAQRELASLAPRFTAGEVEPSVELAEFHRAKARLCPLSDLTRRAEEYKLAAQTYSRLDNGSGRYTIQWLRALLDTARTHHDDNAVHECAKVLQQVQEKLAIDKIVDESLRADFYSVAGLNALQRKKTQEAVESLQRAMLLRTGVFGAEHLDTIWAKDAYAQALEQAGDWPRVIDVRRQIVSSRVGENFSHELQLMFEGRLGLALARRGAGADREEARRLLMPLKQSFEQRAAKGEALPAGDREMQHQIDTVLASIQS